jgi:hypothetical protein
MSVEPESMKPLDLASRRDIEFPSSGLGMSGGPEGSGKSALNRSSPTRRGSRDA